MHHSSAAHPARRSTPRRCAVPARPTTTLRISYSLYRGAAPICVSGRRHRLNSGLLVSRLFGQHRRAGRKAYHWCAGLALFAQFTRHSPTPIDTIERLRNGAWIPSEALQHTAYSGTSSAASTNSQTLKSNAHSCKEAINLRALSGRERRVGGQLWRSALIGSRSPRWRGGLLSCPWPSL